MYVLREPDSVYFPSPQVSTGEYFGCPNKPSTALIEAPALTPSTRACSPAYVLGFASITVGFRIHAPRLGMPFILEQSTP